MTTLEWGLKPYNIGGLQEECEEIFRRCFTKECGIKNVKGLLLFGPPGTGKTLLARQLGAILSTTATKVKFLDGRVNGPSLGRRSVEAFSSEILAEAIKEKERQGNHSSLHIIILDEIDAFCQAKSQGLTRVVSGIRGSRDSVVNKLLNLMNEARTLNNVWLIGTTNKRDLIDEALLRTGCLEVQVEISLPDERSRLQIFHIHTRTMSRSSSLAPDVNLELIASLTSTCTGKEIESVVEAAESLATTREKNRNDSVSQVVVTLDDFLHALHKKIPAFGQYKENLELYMPNVFIECGDRHAVIYQKMKQLVEKVRVGEAGTQMTCLLEGPSGSGKTALAAKIATQSNFHYIKIISVTTMIQLNEQEKISQIAKVFEDAYKFPECIIIIDDIERLLGYDANRSSYSSGILNACLALLKRSLRERTKVLLIGTTSETKFLRSIGLRDAFSSIYNVPALNSEDAAMVLGALEVFNDDDVKYAGKALNEMSLKTIFDLVRAAPINGESKIDIFSFYNCVYELLNKNSEIEFNLEEKKE